MLTKCICSSNHTVDARALLYGSKIGVQHSTAQHSTAQHSTAQHSLAQLAAITMVKVVLMMQAGRVHPMLPLEGQCMACFFHDHLQIGVCFSVFLIS